MILLNTVQKKLDKNEGVVEEVTRVLVHITDILQVYESHIEKDIHTYAVIRSPTGSSNSHRIRETIDDVQKLIASHDSFNKISSPSFPRRSPLFHRNRDTANCYY